MTILRTRLRTAASRIGRDVAHEIVVNVLAAAALGALAFVLLGGRVDDLYTRLRGSAPTSGQVAVLAIDEEALYLWDPADPTPTLTPRGLLAELVAFLDAAGAKVVVLDVLTDVPAPGDDALERAARAHGRVVAAERFAPGTADDVVPFAPGSVLGDAVVPAYANLGAEERTLFSGEMAVRAVPLVHAVARAQLEGPFPMGLVGGFQDDDAPVPALALAGAWLEASEAPTDGLATALGRVCAGVPLRCTAGLDAIGLPRVSGLAGFGRRLQALESSVPINFRGPEGSDGIPTVSGARALRCAAEAALVSSLGGGSLGAEPPIGVPEDLAALLGGRVVLVGRTDAAAADRFVTPYAFPANLAADMAGVRIHAQLVDTLLTGRHLGRVSGTAAWGTALALGVGVLGTARSVSGAAHLTGWLAAAGGLLATGAGVFVATDGLVLDVGPALAVIACALVGVHLYARSAEDR